MMNLILVADSLDNFQVFLTVITEVGHKVMKQKSMNEDQAHNAMRKLAIDHNKRVGEIAGQIITAAELLT